MTRRKLIEVSLPLEDINRGSAHEKSVPRKGHPATMHLWWARRPLAAARAVLFAQLVDDPSSHRDRFPTEEDQKRERERLHNIIRRLVVWENVGDERLLREAHEEILKSTDGNPPAILDPFAGGGTIPLEAQRLGLEAQASDLNPVAVLINRALIEIPPKFAGMAPVFPGAADSRMGAWPRATGLAEDVRRYGEWMRDRAEGRIGQLYPKATLEDGSQATVIAWIWARTVTCPNPACGIEMPLVRSWWLAKKKGKETYVVPEVVSDPSAPSGRLVQFSIGRDPSRAPGKDSDGTMLGRSGASCVACGSAAPMSYVKGEGLAGRLGATLMAVVAEGRRQRVYLPPTLTHKRTAETPVPGGIPTQQLGHDPRNLWTPAYGLTKFSDLFTNRQLTALTTFSDLIGEAREQVTADALACGMAEGARLADGGTDAAAYADAIATYLAFALSKLADWSSSICSWISPIEGVRDTFARQAIPMVWDFVEINPFSSSVGNFGAHIEWVSAGLDALPAPGRTAALATQEDAAQRTYTSQAIATDPPYYDNIGYSDLSDFFYIWLRRSLSPVHPELFATMLVPKAEELVANPYRHGGRENASQFFERGFESVFRRIREASETDVPVTVFYAFKQQELEAEGVASTGWATLLSGIIRAGWSIAATWPVRSERTGRMTSVGTNALASSVVLVLRPRREAAAATNRRGFLTALKDELPQALTEMQQGAIAPVDLAQATIGPGMAIFSRYSGVIESDGTAMTVKTALTLINQALDEVLAEQDGDLDADSRFCLRWYKQFGWKPGDYGVAESMANALNIPVKRLEHGGVLTAREGSVRLLRPSELPRTWDPAKDDRISVWEVACHLARALTTDGGDAAARLMAGASSRVDLESVQLLAYRLYELAQHKDPEDAGLFNALASEWAPLSAAAQRVDTRGLQGGLDLDSL